MKNPYRSWVNSVVRLQGKGEALPLGGLLRATRRRVARTAPRVLIFSPHPDDECIIGGLALRLLREAKMRVVNVAVTLGSRPERRLARLQELTEACAFLGFDLVAARENGLEQINVHARDGQPAVWAESVRCIADILRAHEPRAVFLPHDADWNSTHIGTHHLVVDAMRSLGPEFSCHVVETEFWGAMAAPNLMVEIRPQDLGDLVGALSFHVGEVQRNPYHLRLPAWMQDNVRRGGEVVGGQGGAPPRFQFATLYRARKWERGALGPAYDGGRVVSAGEKAGSLFT